MSRNKDLEKSLPVAGKALPPAKRRDELRASVLQDAGVDHAALDRPAVPIVPLAPHARRKPLYLSWAFVVPVAAVLVLVAVVITGALSMNAMPGDALYPVKRFVQRARVAVAFGSGAKARANRENADARLEELKYAKSKDMEEWYAPLARSATSDLTRSIQGASTSGEAAEAKKKLQEIRDLSRDIAPDEEPGLQNALDDLEKQIDQKYEQSF